MRKTLSAVLAAAALFGGAAISNGAANATDGQRPSGADYVIKDCFEQGVVDGIQYEKCNIIPDGKNTPYVYAIAYGIADKGATDLTIHETYNNVDVIQIGRYSNMTAGTNLKNLTINGKGYISGWPTTRTNPRVVDSFQSKLENVNFNGTFSVADNAFNGAYANIWKHLPDGSGQAVFVDTNELSAFATCNVA